MFCAKKKHVKSESEASDCRDNYLLLLFFCQLTYVSKYVLYTHITQWLKKYINTYCHTLLGYQTADYDTYRLSMFCCKYVRYKVTKIFAFNENVIKK